jgi:hypothetical protein
MLLTLRPIRNRVENALLGSVDTNVSYGIGAFGIVETPDLSWKL